MGYIAVDSLEQGMILSEDVRDINTRLLLSKGQKIVPKHIRILKIWGVTEVHVVRVYSGYAIDEEVDVTVSVRPVRAHSRVHDGGGS